VIDPATGQPLLVPGNSHCYATETDAQGASQSVVSQYSFATGVVVNPDPGDGHFMEDQAVMIEATNIFDSVVSIPGLALAGSRLAEIIVFGAIMFGAGAMLLLMIRRRHA